MKINELFKTVELREKERLRSIEELRERKSVQSVIQVYMGKLGDLVNNSTEIDSMLYTGQPSSQVETTMEETPLIDTGPFEKYLKEIPSVTLEPVSQCVSGHPMYTSYVDEEESFSETIARVAAKRDRLFKARDKIAALMEKTRVDELTSLTYMKLTQEEETSLHNLYASMWIDTGETDDANE